MDMTERDSKHKQIQADIRRAMARGHDATSTADQVTEASGKKTGRTVVQSVPTGKHTPTLPTLYRFELWMDREGGKVGSDLRREGLRD